jgi:uncharacterized SAM-binding protein YcdF (DUF218 family)
MPWPTWRLWLCLLLTLAAVLLWVGRHLHAWLSVTEAVPQARYLIVEGWVPDPVLAEAAAHAEQTGATRVFCTGVPVEAGSYLIGWKTHAEIAAQSLARLGLDPQTICPVPCADFKTERTRSMAVALKAVLDLEPVPDTGRKINLITMGTHGRRSRAIFREVLGPAWEVGVISVPSTNYSADGWYRQSEGVKNVINEICALSLKAVGGN